MKKIIIVSGTRADYGLLRKLIQTFQADSEFETYVAVTGAHLSEHHGKTINLIKQDHIKNIIEVDLKLHGDSKQDICQSLSTGIAGFSEVYSNIEPDLVIVLGDRYELWPACMSATIFNIPVAHIHGGESTEGVIDEAIRHSISKMSHLHFCAHHLYRERLLRMGEQPDRVTVVGAIGIDRLKEMKLLSRLEIEEKIGTKLGASNILCTFHPVTLDQTESSSEVLALISAVEEVIKTKDVKVLVTFPNADTYSNFIRVEWEKLIGKYPDKIFGYVNLGDQLYLSLMQTVNLVLGNSSSGILEAPFFKTAVVNIGRRQDGRLRSGHIIHSAGTKEDILNSIKSALSPEFQGNLEKTDSIYGNGDASLKIYQHIKITNFKNIIFKKFYDRVPL